MKKAVITIIYDNKEMFNSVHYILHCLDCEAFQVTTEENGEYTPETKEPKPTGKIEEINFPDYKTIDCNSSSHQVCLLANKIDEIIRHLNKETLE